MHYLIYVSQAAHPMSASELGKILDKSRDYNANDKITGLLIYKLDPDTDRANFMQLLEGEKAQLDDAFHRICEDKRHHTKVVLEEGEVDERHFPDWTMGFRDIDTAALQQFEGFSDLGSETFWDRVNNGEVSNALDVMLSFYDD